MLVRLISAFNLCVSGNLQNKKPWTFFLHTFKLQCNIPNFYSDFSEKNLQASLEKVSSQVWLHSSFGLLFYSTLAKKFIKTVT